ncbi:MAG: hypothetical protein DRI34_14470 [Deltaproteobacteria bacterium]|nr:MAG: hypothetical protein DRI34_14470 [Deltaproteobacteria bacterium]
MPGSLPDPLLSAVGGSECLLGNEAIVRGALEAGVGFASGYPGTPSSEITDSFARLAGPAGIVFEYSVNEKIALEVAFAACLAGVRAICSMKHLGLMYAGDPLSTIPYVGVRAGLVIVAAGDPSCRTSPNEQDQRWLGPMLGLPVLDPATPTQAHRMARFAFELSETCRLPVLLRPTTRVCHTRQVIELGTLEPRRQARFQREPQRLVPIPANARRLRLELDERLDRARRLLAAPPFLASRGSGEQALLASGAPAAMCADLVEELGLADRLRLLELGAVYPLAEDRLCELLAGVRRLLVVEELTPFLEDALQALAGRRGLDIEILGKHTGHLPRAFEYQPGHIASALHRAFGLGPPPAATPEPEQLPARPPSLCPGCPHRAAQFALRTVFGPGSLYFNDIGCYTLGYGKPLQTADALLCMGAGFTLAAGVAAVTGERTVGILGDSTFFHSGLPALLDAVKQQANVVAVILDNQVTAMTGFQESPEVHLEDGRLRRRVSIAGLVRALGVEQVQVVDPYDLPASRRVLDRARRASGVSVVIFERPCPVFLARQLQQPYRQATYRVDPQRCRSCGLEAEGLRCGRAVEEQFERQLVLGRIRRGGEARGRPPCSQACPLGLCIQGYVGDILAGRAAAALEHMLDKLVLPETVCRVCDRPCERSCVLGGAGEPLAVNELKRYLVEQARQRGFPGGQPGEDCGLRAAVVGAGPAGLAAARELRRRGWRVTLFDAAAEPGGLLRYGIPPYRLPREALERDIAAILSLGVEFAGGRSLGRELSLEGLLADFDAVCLACGGGHDARLELPAGTGAPPVMPALEYLRRCSTGEEVPPAGQVVVVGGGNAAVDAARSARRRGARVTIAYRRGREEMPAFAEEIAAAEQEGVRILCRLAPLELRPGGLLACRTRPGEPDASGRARPVPVAGQEQLLEADLVLAAVGQLQDAGGLGLDGRVEILPGGLVNIDPASGRTSRERVFAAGDLVPGKRTVTWAIASGRRAAASMDAALRPGHEPGWKVPAPTPPGPSTTGWPVPAEVPARQHAPERPAGQRREDFDEVSGVFSDEQARREAARCLLCGSCGTCRSCIDLFGCPAFFSDDRGIHIDPELCMGCGVCAELCPNGAIVKVADGGGEPPVRPGPPEGSAREGEA